MSLINKVTAQYKEKLSAPLLGPLHIPEWDQDIYYRPSASFQQQGIILKLYQDGKIAEAMVQTIIFRCLDEEGIQLFKAIDRLPLMRGDPDILATIIEEVVSAGEEEEEDLGN